MDIDFVAPYDDLPILPEWIAYHYHAVRLRHLIVAVDPVSSTDPKPILDSFRNLLNHDDNKDDPLIIEQWAEADFMPEYFVKGEYGKAPNFVGGQPIHATDEMTWYEWYSSKKHFGPKRISDQTLVNSHRYRQTRFLSRCSEHLRNKYRGNRNVDPSHGGLDANTPVWMTTLDTDEYLAVNPWIMPTIQTEAVRRLEPDSVLRWWINYQKQQTKQKDFVANAWNNPVCRPIPRLLFGAVELPPVGHDEDVVSGTLETLRWKFHAAPSDERNFQQKVTIDLHRVPRKDQLFGDHVFSVHQPSEKLCPPETLDNVQGGLLVPGSAIDASPVVIFHYIGSEERYFSRPYDFRRSPKRYRERSNITYARDDSGWIDQWLEGFVETVGVETAAALLAHPAAVDRHLENPLKQGKVEKNVSEPIKKRKYQKGPPKNAPKPTKELQKGRHH
eukprot:jgi/Psemu1/289614/fgenesh1_pg.377_\